ncbi:MAG: hypothetical protein E6I76_13495 [Chloroflexi bacterium]|nr:MAG: hypothetical protein E6I76_13495 [Chloroflexota bacterium]
MIEPGRILPMYGPLLGGRHLAETAGRESLTVDEMAARLLNELGEDGRALQGLSRVLARAHQLRCAAGAADQLGRATATSGDDDLPAPAVGWWSMCAGPLGEHLEDPQELSAAG